MVPLGGKSRYIYLFLLPTTSLPQPPRASDLRQTGTAGPVKPYGGVGSVIGGDLNHRQRHFQIAPPREATQPGEARSLGLGAA